MRKEMRVVDRNSRTATWALCVLTLLGGALVATHRGEFFPFSIYAMFSRAGRPWTRVLVRDVTGLRESSLWRDTALHELPGRPLILEHYTINQNDVADYVKLTSQWTTERSEGLRALFREPLSDATRAQHRMLLVYRVRGDVNEEGDAQTVFTPVVLFDAERAQANPLLAGRAEVVP